MTPVGRVPFADAATALLLLLLPLLFSAPSLGLRGRTNCLLLFPASGTMGCWLLALPFPGGGGGGGGLGGSVIFVEKEKK